MRLTFFNSQQRKATGLFAEIKHLCQRWSSPALFEVLIFLSRKSMYFMRKNIGETQSIAMVFNSHARNATTGAYSDLSSGITR